MKSNAEMKDGMQKRDTELKTEFKNVQTGNKNL